MHRLTIEWRALARLSVSLRLFVSLIVAIGVVLMHGVSSDHDVMRISAPAGQVMTHETSALGVQGAAVAVKGDASMTMDHSQCLAVLRAPDGAPHVPVTLTAIVPGHAEVSTLTVVGETGLPSRASPPDLATELCISRT